MSTSENVRSLAREGIGVAEIARRLGIRYQHAYNVLKAGGMLPTGPIASTTARAKVPVPSPLPPKQPLTVDELVTGGFVLSGRWVLSASGDLALDRPLPKVVGVYAFAKDTIVLYVGVATMGLAKRLY